MMAKLSDYLDKNGNPKAKEPDKDEPIDGLEKDAPGQAGEPEPKPVDNDSQDDLPEKFKGKTVTELVSMYQEAESVIGRQGNEMGELRKTVDKLIEANLNSAPAPDDTSDGAGEDKDFFTDPDAAVDAAIANNPTVKKVAETADKLDKQAAQQELRRRHPDIDEVFADTGFQKWVGESQHRINQLKKADASFDIDAGDELLSSWKEIKALRDKSSSSSDSATKEPAKKPDVSKASTGSLRGQGGQQTRTGKIIYRADIRKLKRDDPKRYQDLLPAIRKAWSEGRVK